VRKWVFVKVALEDEGSERLALLGCVLVRVEIEYERRLGVGCE
jgi:hypothetical protein